MKRIVVATDFSAASLRAADLAADLAAKYEAELVLLTVARAIGPNAGLEEYAKIEHIQESLPVIEAEALRQQLTDLQDRAVAKGAQRVSTEVPIGDPAEEILASAEAYSADLIVVGSRGHSRVAGLLLGSVSQKVVASSRCPVLVVH